MRLYVFIAAIIITPFHSAAQTGELKGTVTFKLNSGAERPDAGADVIVYYIDSVKTTAQYVRIRAEDSLINNSFLATIYYDEFIHTPTGKTQKEMIRKMKSLDAYPEQKLHDLDEVATAIIRGREVKQSAKAAADENGHYLLKLPAGFYGIIYRSKHLRSHSRAEHLGNIMLDNVEIKSGASVTKNGQML